MLWLPNGFLYLLTPVSALASLGFVAAVFWRKDSQSGAVTAVEKAALGATAGAPVNKAMQSQPLKKDLPCMVHEIRNYTSTLRGNTLLLRRQITDEFDAEPLCRL